MSKKMKSFRLDDETIKIIQIMKEKNNTSEAEVVEKSVKAYFKNEGSILDKVSKDKEIYKYILLYMIIMLVLMVISVIAGCFLYDKMKPFV